MTIDQPATLNGNYAKGNVGHNVLIVDDKSANQDGEHVCNADNNND